MSLTSSAGGHTLPNLLCGMSASMGLSSPTLRWRTSFEREEAGTKTEANNTSEDKGGGCHGKCPKWAACWATCGRAY